MAEQALYQSFLQIYGPSLRAMAEADGNIMLLKESPEHSREMTGLVYLCPICLEHYLHLEGGRQESNESFSLDHFPPQSVGGRQVALVCKPCNNRFGSDTDYALKEYLSFQDFIGKKNVVSYPAKARFDGIAGHYNIGMSWKNGALVHYVPFDRYKLVKEWLFKVDERATIHFSFTMPREAVVHRAMLKAAYLQCFNRWGYDFILSQTGHSIRGILSGESRDKLPVLQTISCSPDKIDQGIYYIKEPSLYRCFGIFFDIKLNSSQVAQKVFVPIPLKKDGNIKDYERFKKLASRKQQLTLLSYNNEYVRNGDYWAYSRISEQLLM